jgi:hypothetical protein
MAAKVSASHPLGPYSPYCLEGEFSEVVRDFFLLPDNGDRAVGVADHRIRYAAHQSPPYPGLPPAAHKDHLGTYALGQVDYLFVGPAHP